LVQRLAVMMALLVLGVKALRKDASADPDLSRFVVLVLVMVIVNAVLCGVISGPYARYQARVVWLIPFLALATAVRSYAPAPALIAKRQAALAIGLRKMPH